MGKSTAEAQAGNNCRFMTFQLAGEEYALEVLKVQEIIGMIEPTPVPKTPDYIRGVINLRGRIIPVVDLRLRFGMEMAAHTDRTCIIVVQVKGSSEKLLTMGIMVDNVPEVVLIDDEHMGPAPEFGAGVNTDYLVGMGKVGSRVIMVLDIDKVLDRSDIVSMQKMGD